MVKKIEALCDGCESNFSLVFDENVVTEYEHLTCPFCKELIESSSEEESKLDYFEEDFFDE